MWFICIRPLSLPTAPPMFWSRAVMGAPKVALSSAPKARRRLPTLAPIVITDAAADRIKTLLSSKPDAEGIKLGVRTRGCNGMSYTLNYADSIEKFDEVVEDKGVKVVIEPRAMLTIIGTTMDYQEDALAAEFKFVNPNAKSLCGCGESFSV